MRVGTVRPDLSLFDGNGEPIRFIEVVDTHAPQSNVHEYALHNRYRDSRGTSQGGKGVHRHEKE